MGVITHANPEPAVRERVPAELPRLLYILRALAGAGWAHYVERLRIGRDALEASVEAVQATDQDAKRLRATLEGLGPAFVKFGQLLSLRLRSTLRTASGSSIMAVGAHRLRSGRHAGE